MGERLLCKQEVIGSIPFTSTRRGGSQGRGSGGSPPGLFRGACEPGGMRSLTIGLCLGEFRKGRLGRTSQGGMSGQVNKGVRWMPWHQAAMKDVAGCDKPRGAASER